MILVSWLFDKLGYMPKVTVDTSWPFPCTQQDYVAPECEKAVVKKATTVAKKKPAAKKAVRKSVRKKA